MTQRKTPASLRRQAEGITGADDSERSLAPTWARKRQPATLVRFQGEYLTPEALHREIAAQVRTGRTGRAVAEGHGDALQSHSEAPARTGAGGSPISENPATSADQLFREEFERRVKADNLAKEGREALPCRSLETTQSSNPEKAIPAALVGPKKKVALALSWNVANLCKTYGTQHIGFLTLTFADHVTDPKEAQRRLNSLLTNVIRKRYPASICVFERQKMGRIHYHLLIVLDTDIRTGVDFEQIAAGNYTSASKALALEWAFWRKTAPIYGFGRTELLPIKSDGDALGLYVGKYIGKGQMFRTEEDKGVRLVRYSGAARTATCKFAQVEKYPNEWRAKVCTFVRNLAASKPHARITSIEDLPVLLGKRWAYHWRDQILALPPADLTVPF